MREETKNLAQNLVYPKGAFITFTSGCYSDFSILGVVKTLKECDLSRLARSYEEFGTQKDDMCNHGGFVAWLIRNGHCESFDAPEVHLGDYDEFSEDLIPKH